MRVYVQLSEDLDVEVWRARHARGEVPDEVPYGLHRLGADDIAVRFRAPLRHKGVALGAGKVRNRLGGHETVAETLGLASPARRTADVVLCMDERTGLPAALSPARVPVVSGVAWLEDPATLGTAHARLAATGLARMAAVFTQCGGLTPVLRERWGLDPARVHEITLGIDPEFYPAQPWPDGSGAPVVAGIGDDRMRDHATLVDAVRAVRAAGTDARLELATTIPVEVAPELGVLHARRMGPAAREMYRRCSVVAVALHPNRVGSGLTVVLEGMASGRPVVVTGNPGVARYVRHGVHGLLVPPGDPAAFADALGSLLADPECARRMGAAGRAAVTERFTSARMAAELRAVLRTAVGR